MWVRVCFFFFFKQKTAYEMRISDWSSDVCSSDLVKLAAGLVVELAHCRHPGLRFLGCNKGLRSRILLRREIAHLLRDLHRAEFGAAHRAEVGGLGALRRQGLVVILLGGVGIERQVELVATSKLKTRAA